MRKQATLSRSIGAIVCIGGLCLAACGPSPQPDAAKTDAVSNQATNPAVILQSLGEDTGCAGAAGATLVLGEGAITRVAMGGPGVAYVVDSGKVRCSIPTNRPSIDGSSLELWHGPASALKRDDQSFSVSSWALDKGTIVGLADAVYCDDAVFDAKGNLAPGACTFSIKMDPKSGAIALQYTWNSAAKAPPALASIAIPPQFLKPVSKTADCQAYNSSDEIALPGFVTDYDVNGDGKPDALLDYTHLRCSTGSPGLCGTGGCTLQVQLGDGKGNYTSSFNDQVLGWRIPKPGTLEMAVHGGLCGLTGAEACMTTLTWSVEKAKFEAVTKPVDYFASAASLPR